MQRTNPDLDIIMDILKASAEAKQDSVFIKSLLQQYCERGSLSRKQLEGLHSIASKINGMHPGKLATLQAIILKKPAKYRSEAPKNLVLPGKNEEADQMIRKVLEKYPQHKRVLYFKAKSDHNEPLSAAEIAELEKFIRLV